MIIRRLHPLHACLLFAAACCSRPGLGTTVGGNAGRMRHAAEHLDDGGVDYAAGEFSLADTRDKLEHDRQVRHARVGRPAIVFCLHALIVCLYCGS